MPAKVRMTMVFLLALLPIALFLGCGSNSDGGSDTPTQGESLNLTLNSTSGANTLTADGTSTLGLVMSVSNQDGQPVANVAVKFATTAGTLSAVGAANANARTAELRQTATTSTITVPTDANGAARVNLTASNAVGTATITAETPDGHRQSFVVSFVSGVPANISLSVTPTAVGVGDTATATATVTDIDGRPVAGTAVIFSITTNSSAATLNQTTVTTDGNGIASATYTGGAIRGTDTIQVSVGTITTTTSVVVQGETSSASTIDLLVSSAQMDSSGVETVTLTALVRDANNNFVSGQEVTFAADSGGIQVTNNITDASGAATAELSTAGDPANRLINLTALAGTLSAANTVNVSGTTLTIGGTNSLVLGDSATLSISLQDSGTEGIAQEEVTITSINNQLSLEPLGENESGFQSLNVTTDSNGQAFVQITAANGGQDTITATAMVRDNEPTITATTSLSVSADDFTFIAPDAGIREVALNDPIEVTVQWLDTGTPQDGRNINFFATRGKLTKNGDRLANPQVTGPTAINPDELPGQLSVEVTATTAGPALITAEVDEPDGPAAQIAIEFVATDPTRLILQASPSQLGVNLPGDNEHKSIITAVVRDQDNNLVKNQQVVFTLTDITGGSIFPSSATTDSFGRASIAYTAGSSVSAQDGVLIDAEVVGKTNDDCVPTDTAPTGPCDRVTLTVGQQSLFVTLGTSHLINGLDDTRYAKPYSVLVTDANSNPVQGAVVELSIFPVRYKKGFYYPFTTNAGCAWAQVLTVSPVNNFNFDDDNDRACENEDINRNGIIETGEDVNNNGELDPENPATVPVQVTTDESGFGIFDVTYAREFTWTTVELEARTVIAGSEFSSKSTFELPGLASDFNNCEISPPGRLSPYGQARSCICDELTQVYQITSASRMAMRQPLLDLAQARMAIVPPMAMDLDTAAVNQILGDDDDDDTPGDLKALDNQEPRVERYFSEILFETISVELNDEVRALVLDIILEQTRQPSLCPTLNLSSLDDLSVELSSSVSELPFGGTGINNPVLFTVQGGTEFRYRVTTTDGSFDPNIDVQAITVDFGQSFFLYTDATVDGEFITVTATDVDTGFDAVIGIFQNAF